MSFFQVLLAECSNRCNIDTTQDWKTISRRTEHEGFSFLTITLGSFRNNFEVSLDSGTWISADSSFATGKGGLPVFLRGFLDQVFSPNGAVLDEPSIEAIRSIRQITGCFQKVLLPTSEKRNLAAIDKYLECEYDLKEWEDFVFPLTDTTFVESVFSVLFAEMLSELDRKIWVGEHLPAKHGPGATADRLKGNQKWMQNIWPSRLNEFFPFEEYLFPNHGWYQHYEDVEIVEPGQELPVKITLVPKTLKTPRIIAIEPTAMQYAQQALLSQLTDSIDGDSVLRSFLSWSSQIPNQDMAKLGSLNGELATLDLSEASDRVSYALVKRLLSRFPHVAGAVDSCRTTSAKLPSGEIHSDLRKFASMGSALCFPIESMVFISLILVGCLKADGLTPTRRNILRYKGKVRTYGDDIICPTVYQKDVRNELEAFGLKVNANKSFWTGKFRESCGKDYFAGFDVSYTKVRRVFPTNIDQTSDIISTVSLRNQLFDAGYYTTCKYLDTVIRRLIPFPDGHPDTGALVAHTLGQPSVDSMCNDLQIPLVKAMVIVPKAGFNSLNEHGALMKHFSKKGKLPFQDVLHLINSGRNVSLNIRRRKVPVIL